MAQPSYLVLPEHFISSHPDGEPGGDHNRVTSSANRRCSAIGNFHGYVAAVHQAPGRNGSVTFKDGGQLGTGALNGSGVATSRLFALGHLAFDYRRLCRRAELCT